MLIFSGGFPIGPSVPRSASGFPLVTSLAGTSVRVSAGGSTVSAFIIGTESHWVRALLPSGTPLGDGTLVVTYQGQDSVPYRISVVPRQFAIYGGTGCGPSSFPVPPSFCVPRAVQNVNFAGGTQLNSFVAPARPGEFLVLWGTGLGFAPGEEASGPIPRDLQVPGLQVNVGDRPARLLYAGRSGCCAGMDEIVVDVPAGIEGCNVPVWVGLGPDGYSQNEVLVSIASGQGACSDPQGLSEPAVRALAAGNLTVAQIGAQPYGSMSDWRGTFGQASTTGVMPFGTCTTNGRGNPFSVDLPPSSMTNVGAALHFGTPGGIRVAPGNADHVYQVTFDGGIDPGDYTIDNGAGGPGAAPFLSGFSIPTPNFDWTNRDHLMLLKLSEGLTVTWSGGDPSAGQVFISVNLVTEGDIWGSFVCYERPDKGTFTVPPAILERAGAGDPYLDELRVYVGQRLVKRVPVPGFDVAEFYWSVPYQWTWRNAK